MWATPLQERCENHKVLLNLALNFVAGFSAENLAAHPRDQEYEFLAVALPFKTPESTFSRVYIPFSSNACGTGKGLTAKYPAFFLHLGRLEFFYWKTSQG